MIACQSIDSTSSLGSGSGGNFLSVMPIVTMAPEWVMISIRSCSPFRLTTRIVVSPVRNVRVRSRFLCFKVDASNRSIIQGRVAQHGQSLAQRLDRVLGLGQCRVGRALLGP
jgi:hypothetical protein